MNRLVLRVISNLCLLLGLALCLPLGMALAEGTEERVLWAFGGAAGLGLLLGFVLRRLAGPNPPPLRSADAFLCVSLGWLLLAILGAVPYVVSGTLAHPVDAWFESMSGFTTTGASVIEADRLEGLPHSVLLWRSLSQWLGGMGIVVLFVALFPSIGAGGSFLVQVETTGSGGRRLSPRIADCAQILWKIYLGLTLVLAALLWVSGLSWFDALNHALTTVSTGGFSTRADSSLAFSPLVQWELTLFMLIGGVNYALLYLLLHKRSDEVRRDPELRLYLWVVLGAVVAVSVALLWLYELPADAGRSTLETVHDKVRYAAFNVVSVVTSTGFGSDDFDRWPDFCRVLLVVLMISGACAGSTAGGLKLARVLLLWKYVQREIQRVRYPGIVQHLKLQGRVVEERLVSGALGLFVLFVAAWLLGVLALELLGVPSTTSVSASLSALSNIGPGLGRVGPSHDYHDLPVVARGFLPLLMLLGRLEFYALLILFLPGTWKRPTSRVVRRPSA